MAYPYTLQDLIKFYHFVIDCCVANDIKSRAENDDDMDEVDRLDGEYADLVEDIHQRFMSLPEDMREPIQYLYESVMNGDF